MPECLARRPPRLHTKVLVDGIAVGGASQHEPIGALSCARPYAILGQGLSSGSVTTILIACGSVTLGGVSAGMLMRRIRRTDAAAV